MKASHFRFALLLSALLQSMTAHAAEYQEYLTREIENRAVARQVISYLTEVHNGSEQGTFWSAYQALENRQKPGYDHRERCDNITKGVVHIWIKSRLSQVFAHLFPETFLGLLAGATSAYARELENLSTFPSEQTRAFWQYVIAQEAAQAAALSLANQGQFAAAHDTLKSFLDQHAPEHPVPEKCE